MKPGSRQFFAAFYDAVSPLLRVHRLGARYPTLGSRYFSSPFLSRNAHFRSRLGISRPRQLASKSFASLLALTSVPTEGAAPALQIGSAMPRTDGVQNCARFTEFRGPSFWTVRGFRIYRSEWAPNYRRFDQSRSQRSPDKQSKNIGQKKPKKNHNGVVQLLGRVPGIHHRLTKDEMLAATTSFFQRLRIRAKWSLIRQMRPYNREDITAFFSWLFLGQIIWIVAGTTTFVSLTLVLINSVFAQEWLAGLIGNYLTKETGLKVVFESAIVPRWKDNCISFKNVFVSRRPGHGKEFQRNVRKGSPKTAAAAAAAAVAADHVADADIIAEEEDTNYTQFDVTIETVNVTLSFARWMNGKGLLSDVEIKGVRGVIDRTQVHWDDVEVDPKSLRRERVPGDFETESFRIEDLLVTVYQPNGFRPFPVSIFSCDLPRLRKQWLFYDFLSANNMSGSYDNSLFTIHRRQSDEVGGSANNNGLWKKTSRLRIDSLGVDHLNRGIEGPFSWIQQGNVDIVADVTFPVDDDLQLSKIVQDLYARVGATVTSTGASSAAVSGERALAPKGRSQLDHKKLIMDLRIQLNDVRATVPLFTRDLSYVNNALIRPIVAYINTRRTYIPINCRVTKDLGEFDGSWTIYDSGLMDDLSAETYDAFARDVTNEQARRRRMKKVGLWSLHLAAQVLLMAMAGSVA